MGNGISTSSLKYEPQSELLGSYEPYGDWTHDYEAEELIATFRFMPCYWERSRFRKTLFPTDTGGIAGIGHLTNQKLVLFYDVQEALSAEVARGAVSGLGTLSDHTGHQILGEVLGAFSHALTSISSDTRKLMHMRAEVCNRPKGVAVLPYTCSAIGEFDLSQDYIAKTSNGIFFVVEDGCENENFMFRPYYLGTEGHDDGCEEFARILKSVGFQVKDVTF